MEAIQDYKTMEKKYFELTRISSKRRLTKEEKIELWFLDNELETIYFWLGKLNEKYYPNCLDRIH